MWEKWIICVDNLKKNDRETVINRYRTHVQCFHIYYLLEWKKRETQRMMRIFLKHLCVCVFEANININNTYYTHLSIVATILRTLYFY